MVVIGGTRPIGGEGAGGGDSRQGVGEERRRGSAGGDNGQELIIGGIM